MISSPRKIFPLIAVGALLSLPLRAQTAPATTAAESTASTSASFAQSLALRTDRIVADPSRPAFGWLTQTSPVAYTAKGALRLQVTLAPWEGETRTGKALGNFTVYGGNLAVTPVPFTVDLRDTPDGFYRYVAEVFEGETSLAKLEKPVVLVAGLEEKQTSFTQRVAKIAGHDSAKASVLYPFDLARVINLGKRVYFSDNRAPDFGLTQAGVQSLYDFPAGLKKSADLLAALEAGRDPVWKAGGDLVRHYRMPEAGEILPYRVSVPSTWDGKTALPLVFILHGNSRDQDFYFDRDGGIIPKTAAKHGFMLVAPLGYWPNGGYNYVPFDRERGARGVAAALAAPQQFGAAPVSAAPTTGGARGGRGGPGGGFGGVNGSTIPALVRSEWSEQDAMHVFDLIKAEYPIDPQRTFLFGYSAGGQGGHYFAQKYAAHWAAVAIGGSGATAGAFYDFERVKSIPMMVFAGSEDPVATPTRAMGEALKARGVDAVTKIYPGATHDTAPSAAIADIFDFFAAHGRK